MSGALDPVKQKVEWTGVIFNNIVTSMQEILNAMPLLKLELPGSKSVKVLLFKYIAIITLRMLNIE